jgi:hypothetical protein
MKRLLASRGFGFFLPVTNTLGFEFGIGERTPCEHLVGNLDLARDAYFGRSN